MRKLKYFLNNLFKIDLITRIKFQAKMSAPIDCPICMDCIESTTKNCVTTECGHCFHTNCLMQSVAHNGFGCPYCRTKMAEEVEDEETIYSDEEDIEMFDEDALRGFRFFWNNLNGEEHDEDDEADEQQLEEWAEMAASNNEESDYNVPSIEFISQKLREQGVTFEQIIHMICNLDHEEYSDEETAERFNGDLFGKIRIIVSNYTPEQALPEPTVEQPKTSQVRIIPRINIHV